MKTFTASFLLCAALLASTPMAFAEESGAEIAASGLGGLAAIGGGVIVNRHHKDFMYSERTDDLKWTKAGMKLYDVNKGSYESGEPLKISKGTKLELEFSNMEPGKGLPVYSRATIYVDKDIEGKGIAQYLKSRLPAETASLVDSPTAKVEVLSLATAEGRVIRGAGTAITWAGIAGLSYSLYKIATGSLRESEAPDADPRMISSHNSGDARIAKSAPKVLSPASVSGAQTSMDAE